MHSSNGTLKSLKCLFPHQGILSFALPFLPTSKKKLMWSSGRGTLKAFLHCIFFYVKQWIHGEKYHTIKPRCASVWI